MSSNRGPGEAAAQLTPDSTFDGNGLKVDVATRVTESANTPVSVTLKASKVWASAASSRDATFVIPPDGRGVLPPLLPVGSPSRR